jgi:hypothetical protein
VWPGWGLLAAAFTEFRARGLVEEARTRTSHLRYMLQVKVVALGDESPCLQPTDRRPRQMCELSAFDVARPAKSRPGALPMRSYHLFTLGLDDQIVRGVIAPRTTHFPPSPAFCATA